jgi:peptidoglycan/LPS O-acetylase OafA/YrhL
MTEATHNAPALTATTVDPTAATPSGRRLGFVDAARGLAALSVCLQHLFEVEYRPFWHWSHYWFNFGAFGVAAFFLVSGFIIPAALEKYASVGRFWLGRLLRLYPMYLFALLLVFLLSWGTGIAYPFADCPHVAVCFAASLTMLHEFAGLPSFFGASWTLGLEMVFYILCSFIWWFGWRRYPVRLAVAAIVVTALLATAGLISHHALPAGRIGLLTTCFFSSMVYHVYRGRVSRRALWLGVPLAMALGESFYLRFWLYPARYPDGEPYFSFVCVCLSWGAAYALFFWLYTLRARSLPGSLLWLGKVSYSFYIVADIVPPLLPGRSHPWLWIVESLAVSLAISACTYRWIERPFMLAGSTPRSPATGG